MNCFDKILIIKRLIASTLLLPGWGASVRNTFQGVEPERGKAWGGEARVKRGARAAVTRGEFWSGGGW